MAEQVVLADLKINSAGVAQGINQANQAFAQGQRGLQNFGRAAAQSASFTDTLTTKLFSFRSMALKLGAGFGIAGAAYAAANALFQLGKDFVMSTQFMKNFTAAATDWYNAMVKGETQTERLARKSKDFWQGTGVGSMQEALQKQAELQEKIFTGFNAVRAEADATREQWRAATAEIDAAKRKLVEVQVVLAKGGVQGVTPEMRLSAGANQPKLLPGASVNLSESELSMFGATSGALQKEAEDRKKLAKAAEEEADALRDLNLARMDLARSIQLYNSATEQSVRDLESGRATLEFYDESVLTLRDHLDALTVATKAAFGALEKPPETNALIDWLEGLNASVDKAAVQVAVIEAAMTAAVSSLGAAFSSGEFSAKTFLATMMQSVSQACFALSAMFAAAAIAASTGIGAAVVQGTPAQLGAAAAGFFAAGVAAGAIGGAIGRGGASSGGRGGGGGGGLVGASFAGAGGPNVTIVINGSLMGTNRDELARELADLVETARSDGSR